MADEIVDDWEQHEGDTSMPEYAVGYNKGWDVGSKQRGAEVLAACAVEVCRFCWRHTNGSEKEYDLPMLATTGIHKGHWIHKKILGYVNLKGDRCEADHIRLLQPAAAALEALLREAELRGLALYCSPTMDRIGIRHDATRCPKHKRITELEKARAEGKG